ncbi:tyrosine-type recombinase/integrase [Spongiactinospora rosea]|uniref:tyrosine-type recombinase/integrase n=1 Tax=Spongiactinospora rosea TaxID=2248750 RepID=UPI0018F6B487|nr:tyrosine-type recombinase/integrase [Spongiactinospora rosea]
MAARHALTYSAVYDLVKRIRRHTGLDFDLHWCRHTAATRMLRDGVPVETVSVLLGHGSIAVTPAVYGHLTAADARKAWKPQGGSPETR